MISRRHFLVGAGAALTGWLVKPDVARQIILLAEEHSRILEVPIHNPSQTLWFDPERLILTLGSPGGEAETPHLTWSDWFLRQDVDPANVEACQAVMEEAGFYDPEFEGPYRHPAIEGQVSESILESYLEGEYLYRDCPEARAFHYLQSLDLGCTLSVRGDPVGCLEFWDGPCPGNDSIWVEATNLQAISGLQQRLIQLGEHVEIRSCRWA